MFKSFAAAALAAVVVAGMPAVAEAGSARGERECRLCKAMERPVVRHERKRVDFKLPPSDPLFKLAPRKPRPVYTRPVRMERPVLRLPKIERKPSDPLFKLAPRKPRPVFTRSVRMERPVMRLPRIKLPKGDPLFKLAPRKPRPVYTRPARMERPVLRLPKIERKPSDPLFKLAPRKPRPVVTHRARKPLFTRSHRGTGSK